MFSDIGDTQAWLLILVSSDIGDTQAWLLILVSSDIGDTQAWLPSTSFDTFTGQYINSIRVCPRTEVILFLNVFSLGMFHQSTGQLLSSLSFI